MNKSFILFAGGNLLLKRGHILLVKVGQSGIRGVHLGKIQYGNMGNHKNSHTEVGDHKSNIFYRIVECILGLHYHKHVSLILHESSNYTKFCNFVCLLYNERKNNDLNSFVFLPIPI